MKLPVWNLTPSTNLGREHQHSVHAKPGGTRVEPPKRQRQTPDAPTDTVLKGHFNDTGKLVLTFSQQQFSPWSWQPGTEPPGLLGNHGPRLVKCLQDSWPRLRCRLALAEITSRGLAFEDPSPRWCGRGSQQWQQALDPDCLG